MKSNIPIIAIVGRPNVGKSTLFNRIIGRRTAIEDKAPSTTRDRLTGEFSWRSRNFILVDTAGLINPTDEILSESIKAAELAVNQADLILLLVDFKDGLSEADYKIARKLRQSRKKVSLVVNKCDNRFEEDIKNDFRRLGFPDIFLLSAISGKNSGDLLDYIYQNTATSFSKSKDQSDSTINLAVVGRPNVGKSTLVNALTGQPDMIVSAIPGTTRDSQDFIINFKNKKIKIIDTAGLRRKSKLGHNTVESYAYLRSIRAIKESKIVVYLIETEGAVALDLNLIGDAARLGKSIILAINKIDLWSEKLEDKMVKLIAKIQDQLKFAPWLPIVFISADKKIHLNNLLNQIIKVDRERNTEIDQEKLDQIFNQAKESNISIYYFTKLKFEKNDPPVFKLSTHKNKKPHFSHLRYLENKIRDYYPLFGTPLFIDWIKN